MSADNFLLIRRVGHQFLLTNESASADLDSGVAALLDHPAPVDAGRGELFETLDLALASADAEYAEYGTSVDVELDHGGDTRAARRASALERFGSSLVVESVSQDGAGSLTIHTRQFEITVQAGAARVADVDAWDLVAWLEAQALFDGSR